jgi:hypothetical protein
MASSANPTVADPLDKNDLAALNKAGYLLNQLLAQFDKATAAGRDITDLQLRRDDLADQVAKIKAAYFPTST